MDELKAFGIRIDMHMFLLENTSDKQAKYKWKRMKGFVGLKRAKIWKNGKLFYWSNAFKINGVQIPGFILELRVWGH